MSHVCFLPPQTKLRERNVFTHIFSTGASTFQRCHGAGKPSPLRKQASQKADTPHPRYGQPAGGTHPTGMHPCFCYLFVD